MKFHSACSWLHIEKDTICFSHINNANSGPEAAFTMNDFASNQASVLFAQASSSLHSIVNEASGPELALLICEKQIVSFSI
jgi:hypothetical protein